MKERGTVADAEGHRPAADPADARRANDVAVERGVGTRRGERRNHVNERIERPALQGQHTAREALGGEALVNGVEQIAAGLQRDDQGMTASLRPLNAVGMRGPGLRHLPHRGSAIFASSKPRASSSSRTMRLGTLP